MLILKNIYKDVDHASWWGKLELADRPWEIIHINICGPFPSREYLFTMMDGWILRCTKAGTLINIRKWFCKIWKSREDSQ